MGCAENRSRIESYLDGELEAASAREVEAHLKSCSECTRVLEGHRSLRSALSAKAVSYQAPRGLERLIRSSLREVNAPPRAERAFPWRWLSVATSLAALAVLALVLAPRFRSPSAEDLLAQEVFASHVRSLMANHLTDVASTDQHTVKPWFDGKLDFAPPVPDFAADGFPLVGGRLDYLNNHPVAALVYQRRKHLINLFVWPVPGGDVTEKATTRQGYNILYWRKSGMNFWAVSDVNAADLEEFARLARQR